MEAATLEALYNEYDPSEFIIITMQSENSVYETPSTDELMDWAETYGLSTPVVAEGSAIGDYVSGSYGIPYQVLLGPGMVILDNDGIVSESDIAASVEGSR